MYQPLILIRWAQRHGIPNLRLDLLDGGAGWRARESQWLRHTHGRRHDDQIYNRLI
jgi:hypothetical protein